MLTAMTFSSVFKLSFLRILFGVVGSPCASFELNMEIGKTHKTGQMMCLLFTHV